MDLAFVEKDNPAYFLGRRERNHARMEAKNDAKALDAMAAWLNKVEGLLGNLKQAEEQFEELAGHGQPFYPERYELMYLCGLKERSK